MISLVKQFFNSYYKKEEIPPECLICREKPNLFIYTLPIYFTNEVVEYKEWGDKAYCMKRTENKLFRELNDKKVCYNHFQEVISIFNDFCRRTFVIEDRIRTHTIKEKSVSEVQYISSPFQTKKEIISPSTYAPVIKTSVTPKNKINKILTGKEFGKWFVLGPSSSKKYYYECQCTCGIRKDVQVGDLTSGKSKGCRKCNVWRGGRKKKE